MSIVSQYKKLSPEFLPGDRMWRVELVGRGLDNLTLTRAKVPTPGERELLVRVDALSLCASDYKLVIQGDLHTRIKGRNLQQRPVVPGHEVSLTIVGVGELLKKQYRPGERCTLQPDIYIDGKTNAYGYQLEGGLQQFQVIGSEILEGGYLFAVDDRLGYAQVAVIEPWACVHYAYEKHRKTRSVKPGGSTWIVGAGPLGTMHLEKAIKDAASHIYVSEINPARLQRARRILGPLAERDGTQITWIDVTETPVAEVIRESSLDDVILCYPSVEVFEEAFRYIAWGGYINVFAGFPDREKAFARINLNDMHYGNITIVATSGSPIAAMKRALRDCQKGVINPNNCVAAVGGIKAAVEGLALVHRGTFPGKIVIYPQLDLPLLPIEQLTGGNPWSNQAEAEFLERYLPASTNT